MIRHLTISLICLFTFLCTACDSKKEPPPPPAVLTSTPITTEITPYLIETGNTVSSNSVSLVARVSGYLDAYQFTDGSIVKKGDELFVIEPEPYRNQLTQAQATLASDIAQYQYDQAEYLRQLKMYKKQATSQADLQRARATRDESAAAIESAKANVDNARINYSYTHVKSPIDGRIGRHLVDVGNLVGQGAPTTLAIVQKLDPIYIYFTINELDLLKLRKIAEKAGVNSETINQIPIEVSLQDETDFPHKGYLDFAATELDAATGTIEMRGILPNHDYALLPGLYGKVRVALAKPSPQLTIPDVALMNDQIGSYVYTVDKNDKVQQKRVTIGASDNGMTTILNGLKANDQVIVDGIQNARPGLTVSATEKDVP